MPTPPLSPALMREALEAVNEHGTITEAAVALGIKRETLQSRVNRAREAQMRGALDDDIAERIPEGFAAKGVSTLYDAEGNVRAQWVKTDVDREKRLEALKDVVAGLREQIAPLPPVSAPQGILGDLCNLYTFSDYHLGMLAWHREGGDDWDLDIAETTLAKAFRAMVDQSPRAHTAVINLQGDFLHTDGKVPVTPAHGHVLDADTRFPKLRQSAIRLIRGLILYALETHAHVHLIVAEGNHDEESSGWLADMFAVQYENEPRLTVDDEKLPFYVFEWGMTMLGIHHGHKVKNEQLPLLFAAQFPESWGRTKRREIHCGHRHHRDEKEYNGVTVVQHPTLAARDAYAARGGWIADRAAWAMTYHKQYGAVGRVCVTPEMVRA